MDSEKNGEKQFSPSEQDEADAIVSGLLQEGGARARRERANKGEMEGGVGTVTKNARTGEAFQTLRKKKRLRVLFSFISLFLSSFLSYFLSPEKRYQLQ